MSGHVPHLEGALSLHLPHRVRARRLHFQGIDLAHELGDELVDGTVVDLVGGADLHQSSLLHDADAVRHHHRLLQGVRDVDEGLAGLPVDVLELLLERLAQAEVERGERLVEEQDLRVEGERAGERDALALSARALVHALVVVVHREAELVEQRARALAPHPGRDPGDLEWELDVLPDALVREEREVLKDHAGRAPVGGHLVDHPPVQPDLAAGGLLHAHQHADHRRLPGARGSDEREELALANVQANVAHGDEVAECLRQPVQYE